MVNILRKGVDISYIYIYLVWACGSRDGGEWVGWGGLTVTRFVPEQYNVNPI